MSELVSIGSILASQNTVDKTRKDVRLLFDNIDKIVSEKEILELDKTIGCSTYEVLTRVMHILDHDLAFYSDLVWSTKVNLGSSVSKLVEG